MDTKKEFEEVFNTHYEGLVFFCMSLGASDLEADDVVQQVFLSIWNRKEEFDWQKDSKSYLFNAVRNRTKNIFRDKRANVDFDDLSEPLESDISAEEKIHITELERKIDQIIDQLPPKCRTVFVLSRKEEMSHAQIAELLEISVKTVENHITKALKILRKYIDEKK